MRDRRLSSENGTGGEPTERHVREAERLAQEMAAGRPDPGALYSPRVPGGTWLRFEEAFLRAVREGTRRQEWVDAFASDIERGASLDTLVFDGERDRVERSVRGWNVRRTHDPFEVWHTGDEYIHERHLPGSSAQMLAALDPGRFVRALEALPQHPGLLANYLNLAGALDDIELWHRLVDVAPPALDEAGKPTGSMLVLLLLEELIRHVSRIEEALVQRVRVPGISSENSASDLADFQQVELPGLISNGYQHVLDRADGPPIAIHFLSELVRGRFVRDSHGSRVPGTAFDLLAGLLASSGATVADIHAASRWRGDAMTAAENALGDRRGAASGLRKGDRIDSHTGEGARTLRGDGILYLMGAAAMVLGHRATQTELSAVWAWVREAMEGRDEALRFLEIRGNGKRILEVYYQLGSILARQLDPLSQWLAAYKALEPQRRRAARRHRYEDFDAVEPSVVLLRIGLGATDALAATAPSPACALWEQIERQARRLWLTSARRLTHDARHTLLLCYAYAPHVFKERLRDGLQVTWPILGTDPGMTAQSAWYLWKNGVEPPALRALAASLGLDLERAIREAKQWAMLTEREEEFSSDIQDLANALGVVLADERASPTGGANGASSIRSALTSSVPWGAALLARLDAEDCHLRNITMLDTRGSTWALRVELPREAAVELGLGSEIRIVAARGEITGLDLWKAQAIAPDDREADPDFVVVASGHVPTLKRLPQTAGPWGQRVPWAPLDGGWPPLTDAIRANQPAFDVFDLRTLARGRQLCGREAELQSLVEHIARGESMAVLGLRKVGKTSLVRAVAEQLDPTGASRGFDRNAVAGDSAAGAQARLLWADAQGVLERTLDGMAAHLLDAIERRDPSVHADALLAGSVPPASILASVLRKLTDRADAPPLVLVIDEYDLMFEGFDGTAGMAEIEWLFNLIRGLAQEGRRISMVLLGRDPVFLERPMMGPFPNPLLGWVKPIWLGPLPQPAAAELVQRLARRCGFSAGEQELQAAWSWTAGHPLLLRQFGSALRATARRDAPPATVAPGRDETVRAFLSRDAVSTIVREVDALLAFRFPDAHALFHELCNLALEEGAARWAREGAVSAARRTLVRFRLIDDATGRFARVFRAFWSEEPSMLGESAGAE